MKIVKILKKIWRNCCTETLDLMEIAAKVKFSLYLSVLCDDSRYGCCPDGITAASGQNYAGCADEDPCKVRKLPSAFLKLLCQIMVL